MPSRTPRSARPPPHAGVPHQPPAPIGESPAAIGAAQTPHAPMPVGPPTVWPASPPPPPSHAPPVVLQGMDGHLVANDAVLAAVTDRIMPMLAAATRASEQQVGAEMRKLQSGFAALTAKAGRVQSLLQARDGPDRGPQQDPLYQTLMEVERRWDQEIKAVKRELHQTILAHNHNADVMADHKTAIDKICAEVDEVGHLQFQGDAVNEVQEQLQRIAYTLENSNTQDQDIDALLRRGEALSLRMNTMGITHAASVGASVPSHPSGRGPMFSSTFPHGFA